MLPAAARLRRSGDFRAAVRSGRRAGTPALVVHLDAPPATADTDPALPRIGFVVSRSVGPAVVRNRVRRRLRHLMRQRLTRLPVGSHVVVRAMPAAAEASWPELGRQLDRALDRLGRPRSVAAAAPAGSEGRR